MISTQAPSPSRPSPLAPVRALRQAFQLAGALALPVALCVSCDPAADAPPADRQLADSIGRSLTQACPMRPRDSVEARQACADKIAALDVLRDGMAEPFRWGGQKAGHTLQLEDNPTTRFNPLVWRKMYLSLFMFPGSYRVEYENGQTVLRMPYQFRNGFDIGDYPYPFWHSQDKWDSYQYATELLFVIKDGKVLGALRSEMRDMARPYVAHTWDGNWHWTASTGAEQPYVSLYRYLFSGDNPHVNNLDLAYRKLESGLRQHACFTCHSPDNQAKMNPLELFSYPNQALHSRRKIVQQLEMNVMPPATGPASTMGIADEQKRQELVKLAREFATVGDAALAYEKEPVQP